MTNPPIRFLVLAFAAWAALPSRAVPFKWSHPDYIAYGVSASQCEVSEPRDIRYSVVRVDLKIAGVGFTATGAAPKASLGKPLPEAKTLYNAKGEKPEPAEIRVVRRPTAEFFVKCASPKDQGGQALDMLVAFNSCPLRAPYSGTYADPRGLVISDGAVVVDHPVKAKAPIFVVRKNGSVEIAEALSPAEYPDVLVAHTGLTLIRKGGKDVADPSRVTPGPKTAVGLTADRRTLYVLTADDGVKVARGTGANNHDLNEVFADLGVADAMICDTTSANALVVKDREKGYRVLNRCPEGREAIGAPASIGIYAVDRRAGGQPAAQTESASAKFLQTRLMAYREKQDPVETLLKGQVKGSLNFAEARVKRPVLSVSALFDVAGEWRFYDVILDAEKVNAGACLPEGTTLAKFSKNQPEVAAEAWSKPVWGDPKVGFFRTYGVNPDKAKLIGYRLELWQGGNLLAAFDSDKAAVKRAGAPEDWFLKGKYPKNITYFWPPETKPAAAARQNLRQKVRQRQKLKGKGL